MKILSSINKLDRKNSFKLCYLLYFNQLEALKQSILIVCTGNSCRSQMAEGFAKGLGYIASSAGTEPENKVNKYAIKVMEELNIDISNNRPKHISNIDIYSFNIIITVCSNARDNCPIFSGFNGKLIHHPFSDPSNSNLNKLNEYRNIRDQIKLFLENILA